MTKRNTRNCAHYKASEGGDSMTVVTKKLTDLRHPSCNVRLHNDHQIKEFIRSIEMFGQLRPIVVDENGVILAGNGLYEALNQMEREEADCYVVDNLSEKQKKKLMLADNRVYELGETDHDAINKIFDELEGDLNVPGWDLASMMDTLGNCGDLLDDIVPQPAHENYNGAQDMQPETLHTEINESTDDGFELGTLNENTNIKYGQIYQLGRHRLMCGDAICSDDVEALMAGAKADLLLTDPPYNVDYKGEAGQIMNDNMEDAAFMEFLQKAFVNAKRQLKQGGAIYIWHADSKGYEFRQAARNAGLQIRQCLIWCKNTLVLGRQDYQWKHEPCLYGWTEGKHHWYSDRKQTTVLNYNKPQRNELHPTMKPVPLFDYLICNSTKPGDIVLDTFAGSGTTLIACERDGRTAYCMELDPRFASVIIDRWETLTGKQATLISPNSEVVE